MKIIEKRIRQFLSLNYCSAQLMFVKQMLCMDPMLLSDRDLKKKERNHVWAQGPCNLYQGKKYHSQFLDPEKKSPDLLFELPGTSKIPGIQIPSPWTLSSHFSSRIIHQVQRVNSSCFGNDVPKRKSNKTHTFHSFSQQQDSIINYYLHHFHDFF